MEVFSKVEVNLLVSLYITLSGKKYSYKLPDNAYGEWIIYENDKPKYYLNIFDKEYELVRKNLNHVSDFENYLITKFQNSNPPINIKRQVIGFSIEKPYIQKWQLEKLPLSFLK